MAIYVDTPNGQVPGDDLAAQALTRQLRDDTGQTHKLYRRGTDYLIMPGGSDYRAGWSCTYAAYGPVGSAE
jgi:hypothetical protein